MRYRALLALALLALAGCSTTQTKAPEEYFRDANKDFQAGSFAPAIASYRELLDQHPFSDYTEEVELKIAHAQFLDGDYISAVISFADFQRRYPTSPYLPFVGYHLGMAYVYQMGSPDRDQTAAQSAHAYFSTLINQHPDSPFAELGRGQLAKCRESMALHETGIAKFYERRGNRKAAEIRRLLTAAEFGDTPPGADALLELAEHYAEVKNQEYVSLAYRALRQLHPGSPQTRRARRLVDQAVDEKMPPTTDPVDLLLIANNRRRPSMTYMVPEVPRTADRGPRGAAPGAQMPPMDPFGRGNVGY